MQQSKTKSVDDALTSLAEKGWAKVENVYESQLIEDVKEEFYRYESAFIEIQTKGIYHLVENATHHSFVICRDMLKLLERNPVHDILDVFFEGPYILNTMGLSRIVPQGKVYTQNIHRDVRSFHGANRLWINTLILLDDTDSENGATWIWEGSQHFPDKPSDEDFYNNAIRIEGKKGDVIIFDGNIWHAAGANHTDQPRHIITPFYSKPFIKQQLDYPKALGADFCETCSPHLRQLLGYNARVPVTLDEFYQRDEDRFYKKDQG